MVVSSLWTNISPVNAMSLLAHLTFLALGCFPHNNSTGCAVPDALEMSRETGASLA